jgi:hypothetical protein
MLKGPLEKSVALRNVTAVRESVELMDCSNSEEDGNATVEKILLSTLFLLKLRKKHMIQPVG